MIYSQNLFGRPYVLPEGVPAGAGRGAAQGVHGDDGRSGLIAEANKAGMELGERSGEEVQALVAKLYALPASVIERAKQAMVYKAPK